MSEWLERSRKYTVTSKATGFSIAFAGMKFEDSDLAGMADKFARAAREMKKIEAGEIKNPDEQRKVTHFTDRINYPKSQLFADVEEFASAVRDGKICGSTGKKFEALVVNGIGGSALGPQLMQFAINGPYWNELSSSARNGYLKIYFLDNTDSAEFTDLLAVMDPEVTLQLVISKSGGTRETKNNMIAMEAFYASRGLDFARHAVAITMDGSQLDQHAKGNNWLRVFEMADSIGGRTSETSIVGHVPAALTGINFARFLEGACVMDEWTREENLSSNPAMMLSAMWYIAGQGKGDRNMVIVPYSDRLVLLSRYLQQLVMESLGKELDLDGKKVCQGLNVFGNKGGTDAHAFIQQLNDGRDDFFATFIEVLKDSARLDMGNGVAIGDYLHGFLEGLSAALLGKGRQIITIRVPELDVFTLGQIIALYERAVAMYAEYININAFHQPGVQAYKLAANGVLELAEAVRAKAAELSNWQGCACEFAKLIGREEDTVVIAGLLDKAAVNNCGVTREFCTEKNTWIYGIK